MILKKFMPVIALVLVFAMLSPSLMAVELNENETIIDAASEHESEYDKVVNIADESSMTNDQTWNPTYSGIFMGSSTPESLFKFNDVTYTNASIGLAWKFSLTTNQIMSGVSEWTMRLPLYNDGNIDLIVLNIFRLINDTEYGFKVTGANRLVPDMNGTLYSDYAITVSEEIDPTDTSVADGDDEYTVDNRVYYRAIAPLYPNTEYVAFVMARYVSDSNFTYYMVPQDVCGDSNLNTTVVRYNYNTHLDSYVETVNNFEIDPGFSFDFRTGMGSGVFGKRWNLGAGSTLDYGMYVEATGALDGYHSIMIPFKTDDGVINATVSVDVYDDTSMLVDTWTEDASNYQDYILACSASTIATTGNLSLDIEITINTAESITLYFRADPDDLYVFMHSQYVENDEIKFDPLASYMVSANEIEAPNSILSGAPINPIPEELERNTDWAFIAASLLFPGLIPFNLLTAAITGGEGVVTWLVRNAGEFLYAGAQTIAGWISNAIDAIWDVLVGIGEFLWSIGEMIWDALEWLAEQLVEYSSYLLGLLVIAAALLIFFFPIHYQFKLWTSALLLAQGKVAAAQKGFEEVASDISGKVGKVKGMI